MRFLKGLFGRVCLTTRTIDEILVISVTDSMTRRSGVDALLTTVTEAIEQGSGKVLLELAPSDWDEQGFDVLAQTLGRTIETQIKVACKLGPIPVRTRRWEYVVVTRVDCFDRQDEAIEYLKEDC